MDTFSELHGTRWKGTAELWVDPLGNELQSSECTVSIDGDVVSYTWSYQGKSHEGRKGLSSSTLY